MTQLPTKDLRSNIATWSVPNHYLPATTQRMLALLPTEGFDQDFQGQRLTTTYFDTEDFRLRKARASKGSYLVARIRCYKPSDVYAFSVKTEDQKFRVEIDSSIAELLLTGGFPYPDAYDIVPADLQARLMDIAKGKPLVPVIAVKFRRYAVEDDKGRLTLDVHITSDTGKNLPTNILEQKGTSKSQGVLRDFPALGLRPIKLSKFLWATER